MKDLIAAIYVDFETTIAETSDMEQSEGLIGLPRDKRLMLKFHHLSSEEKGEIWRNLSLLSDQSQGQGKVYNVFRSRQPSSILTTMTTHIVHFK